MWETQYSREPINYRLFFLNFFKRLWALLLSIVIGAVLVGGIYCFVYFVMGDGYQYRATTMYYVTYAEDAEGKEFDYYNYYTWQELIKTDEMVAAIQNELADGITADEIRKTMTATVDSDYRYLYTRSVDGDQARAIAKEEAVKNVIMSLPDSKREIEGIQIIDKPDFDKLEDISLIFVQRAFIFGGVIGLIAACIVSVFYACTDTSVYLPSTLEKRYKIPALGAPSMKEFEDNCKAFLSGKKKVGFINVDESPAALKEVFSGKEEEVSLDIRSMKKLANEVGAADLFNIIPGDFEKVEIPNPTLGETDGSGDGIYASIRECDGLVIVVKAGAHNGKRIERLLEQLSRLEIKPTGFILTCEDEKLIRAYYK